MSTKKANLILTTCSMAWGTSYIFMKLGIEGLSPLMLMALRTGIAFLILVLIFFKRLLNVNKRLLLYSAITGFLLFTNLTPILYGLNTITASQSGFILSTTVVLVPIIHPYEKTDTTFRSIPLTTESFPQKEGGEAV